MKLNGSVGGDSTNQDPIPVSPHHMVSIINETNKISEKNDFLGKIRIL